MTYWLTVIYKFAVPTIKFLIIDALTCAKQDLRRNEYRKVEITNKPHPNYKKTKLLHRADFHLTYNNEIL